MFSTLARKPVLVDWYDLTLAERAHFPGLESAPARRSRFLFERKPGGAVVAHHAIDFAPVAAAPFMDGPLAFAS